MWGFLTSLPVLTFAGGALALFVYCWSIRPGANGTPPGPMGLPLVGFAPFLGKYAWKTFDEMRSKYPHLFGIYLGKQFTVVIQDYETLKTAFVDQQDVFGGRPQEFVTKYFSSGRDGKVHGLIALEGPKWQQTHHFSYNSFKPRLTAQDLDKVMLEQVNNVVNAFKKEKGSFNPDEYLYSANVNILSYIMFGRSLNYLGTEFHAVTKGLFDAFDAIAGGLIQQYPWLRFIPGTTFQKQWSAVEYSVAQGWQLLEKELEDHERTYSPEKVRDFIDGYLRHVQGGDNEDLLAYQNKDDMIPSVLTLWAAGPEATSIGDLWGLLYMAAYPDIQKKIHDELDKVVGRNKPVHTSDREKLPYTWATMYEFLRLGGNVPLGNARATLEDTELLGYRIPKRTNVLPNTYSIHRNPKYWKDPQVFNPERFLGPDGKVKVPPQFIIWSLGPRHCPGRDVANLMMFTVFANLMQQFEVRPAPGKPLPPFDEFLPGISSRPLHYEIKVIPRS